MLASLAVLWRSALLLLAFLAVMPQLALALTASQVYEQVKDSVVIVKAYDQKGQQIGMGSGVMLPSGDIVTNYHVVKGGVRYIVGKQVDVTKLSDAELKKLVKTGVLAPWILPATLKSGDPDKDLCLLITPGLAAKPARLGKAARLKVGEPVYAVGAPQGLELSLSEGIVSQLRGGPPPIIQTTVAISGGSSGGGLFNAEAELVGITTFYLKDSQSLNFAVPVEWVGEVARDKMQEQPIGEAPKSPETPARPKVGWEDQGRPPVKTRFTKAQDAVITDSATGLEWYVGPDQDTNWNQAKSWTESLTVAGGGWRMPTIQELKALYQKDASPTNMDPTFKTTGVWVWSGQTGGTSSPGYPGAWGFYFLRGQENRYLLVEAVGYRAFAVRSQSAVTRVPVKTRFTKAQDGVITDSATGLEWYVGPDQDTNWNQAKSWTESLTVAGGGWRMPTIQELNAIYQQGAGRNNIDPIFQTTGEWLWSGQMKEASSAEYPTAAFFGPSSRKWGWVGLNAAVDGRAFAVRSRR